jgi:Fe-S oxidoreductase
MVAFLDYAGIVDVIAGAILVVKNILQTGAQIVVSTNPGCLLQIRAGLRKAGARHIEVLHIADFLDRASKDPI